MCEAQQYETGQFDVNKSVKVGVQHLVKLAIYNALRSHGGKLCVKDICIRQLHKHSIN